MAKIQDPHAPKKSGGERKKLDPAQVAQAKKRFEWLVTFMIVNFRFVHHILGMMVKVPDPNLGTMGVRVIPGGSFELRYDPAFVEGLTDEHATYIFAHEVYHLVLHHCTSRRFNNHWIGNVAHDLAVNELIPVIAGACERPKDEDGKPMGCFVDEFKKDKDFSDIQERQSAEWYYDYLLKKVKDSGGGLLDKLKAMHQLMDCHDGWKEDEIADEKVRAKVSEIDKQDLWGNTSEGSKEAIRAAQIRKINWRALVRRHIGNLVWKDRTSTRKRPNRRTGIVHPGNKRIHVDRHLVAIDTSGSVDSELLAMFLSAINSMIDVCPIDMMLFDCHKQEGPLPFDKKKIKYDFTGRGGTDFGPVIEESNKGKYKSLVIFTDGEASPPPHPKTAKVLWVLPANHHPPVEWGKKVIMTKY